jgi:hypothetical protein
MELFYNLEQIIVAALQGGFLPLTKNVIGRFFS